MKPRPCIGLVLLSVLLPALLLAGCGDTAFETREGYAASGMLIADSSVTNYVFSNITFWSSGSTDKVQEARVSFTIERTGTPDPFGLNNAMVCLAVRNGDSYTILWETVAGLGSNTFVVTQPMPQVPFYGTQFAVGLKQSHPVSDYPVTYRLEDFRIIVKVRT
ncbi:MAG: hypothetical protein ACUVRM_05740 [Bacillota bacterium]